MDLAVVQGTLDIVVALGACVNHELADAMVRVCTPGCGSAALGRYFEATRFTASTATSGLSKNMTWPASTLRTLLSGHCWATSRSIST